MEHSTYQLIINALSVGTLPQTLVFYTVLFFMFRIILSQLDTSPKAPAKL